MVTYTVTGTKCTTVCILSNTLIFHSCIKAKYNYATLKKFLD